MRQQALVPIPSGPTLAGINAALLAQMDARLDTIRDQAGQTIGMRFAEEQRQFRPTPLPFASEATTLATVSPRALVRLEGACTRCRVGGPGWIWSCASGRRPSRLSGGTGRRLRTRANGLASGRSITGTFSASSRANRRRFARSCRISCGISASPFPAIWDQLHGAHGPRDAARLFAKVLGQLDTPRRRRGRSRAARRPRHGDAAAAGAHAGAVDARSRGARHDPRAPPRHRGREGCAADYDGWLLEVAV